MALAMHEVKRTRSVVLLSAIRSLCGVLVAASFLAGSLGAQEASLEADGPSPATIQDIVVLLDVGVDSRTIMTFLDRRGWPGDLSLSALTTIFRFDVSTAFRSALLQRAGAVPEIAALPLRFKVLDLCAAHGLTLIHPRTVTPSVTLADPLCVEMEERPGASWFDGTRYFAWWFDGGRIPDQRAADALRRMIFRTIVENLEVAGIELGDGMHSQLTATRGGRTFPMITHHATNRKTGRRGVVCAGIRIDESTGRVVVMGFMHGPEVTHESLTTPLADLGEMLDSVTYAKVDRPAVGQDEESAAPKASELKRADPSVERPAPSSKH